MKKKILKIDKSTTYHNGYNDGFKDGWKAKTNEFLDLIKPFINK